MKLDRPTYEYLTSATRTVQSKATLENASSALNEVAQLAYANVRVVAVEMLKQIVMPFCIEFDYEFMVNKDLGTFTLNPCSNSEAPKEQFNNVLAAINQDTCLAIAPKLFMLMPSFSQHFKGTATSKDGDTVNIKKFFLFEHKCPNGWLGGYEVDFGNSAWTGTLRPDELTFTN